jgi:hypothetical protein
MVLENVIKEQIKKNNVNKKDSSKQKDKIDDLLELVGCFKFSNKKMFDYEEVELVIDQFSKEKFEKSLEERLVEAEKPTDLSKVSSNSIDWRFGAFQFNRYVFTCFTMFLLSIFNILTGIVYYEYDYKMLYADNLALIKLSNNTDNDQITSLIIEERDNILLLKDVYELISYSSLYILIFITLLTVINYVISRLEYFNWKHSICYISKDRKIIFKFRNLYEFSKF